MGKWLMLGGALLLLVGALMQFAPQTLNWFGRLPGDIRIDNGNTRVFIPITSMLIVSIVLSLLIRIFSR